MQKILNMLQCFEIGGVTMNLINNLLTLATTTTNVEDLNDQQFIWLVLGGLFLVIIFVVVIAVVTSAASTAAAVTVEDDSAES